MASPYLSLLFLLPLLTISQASPPVSLQGCRNKCGSITVPYPFGFEPDCFREGFDLVCNESYYPPRLFIWSIYEITDLSPSGELHILFTATRVYCNSSGDYIPGSTGETQTYIHVSGPYLLSIRNSFFAVGCPNQAYFINSNEYVGGCLSVCKESEYDLFGAVNGSCTGVGCCQTSIPTGMNTYQPLLQYFKPGNGGHDFIISNYSTNCSYGFLADSNWFRFDTSYLSRTQEFQVQVAIDWAVRNVRNCSYARRNMTDFACKSVNSFCVNSDDGIGYLCKCSKGYEGNPYIDGGCQDINECALKYVYPCYGDCINTIKSYNCTCPRGTEGDATTKDGASVGVILVAFASFWLYLELQKRKLITAKRRFFEQNGGFLLQQQKSSFKSTTLKIYSKEELEKATDKFSEERVLGRAGHGIVYKGIFEDGTVAAIKKSKIMEDHETKEFVKEMLILSQINHKNVVKLFGCCLEVEVPMLVYEYISNGTLYHYIHDKNLIALIPSDERLRIAAESADALAYMHSSASPPILHGDVKTANILLDDNLVTEIATLVQGPCGYLDPEYLLTCQLTAKSDVYSFAVVILELLTRKKALYFEGPEDSRSLASSFCMAKMDGRFVEILDGQVRDELKLEVLEEIGDLVIQCLSMNREERPTMREVAETLEKARRFQRNSLAEDKCTEEIESLLGDSVDMDARESSVYYSFA